MVSPGTDPLADTGGNSTGVTLTFNDGIYTNCCGDGFSATPYAALMGSYLYDGASNTMTVAGLAPDATFDLYIYTQGDIASNGRAIEVDANGVIADSAPTDATASTFILGQNYLDLAVTADVNGLLTINYSTLAGESDINGFQLVQTGSEAPEPGTPGSLAAGLAVLAWRKRRGLAR
ncbi:MAG: PEP-CTERM sorting domain-containing protein [Bryobacteraceae bacterium]